MRWDNIIAADMQTEKPLLADCQWRLHIFDIYY